jgi:hypothetical protein
VGLGIKLDFSRTNLDDEKERGNESCLNNKLVSLV